MSAIIQASPLEKLSQEPLPTGDSCVLVIFGASGDLTKRKLIPGLYNLSCVGCMNREFEVLGIGRTPMSSAEFRKKTGEAAAKSKDTRDFSESGWKDFETRLHYMVGDINDPKFYPQLRVRLEEMERNGSSPNHLFYVSTPASVVRRALRSILFGCRFADAISQLNNGPTFFTPTFRRQGFPTSLMGGREQSANSRQSARSGESNIQDLDGPP